jgi:agmatine deiminase
VAPGVVACPVATGRDDPNAEVYEDAARRLAGMTTARGLPIQVVRIASAGRVEDEEGTVVPASHMNFLISDGACDHARPTATAPPASWRWRRCGASSPSGR